MAGAVNLSGACRVPVVVGLPEACQPNWTQAAYEGQMSASLDTETRPYNPTELAFLVSTFRGARGWSQETLAEQSGLTVRTIQRVEAAEPSSLDTRRALARAFEMPDINVFSQLQEFATPEAAARAREDFDRRYTVLDVRPISGRALVQAIGRSGPFRAVSPGSIGQLPLEAEEVHARILDYLQDVMDVADVAGHVEMLGYGDELEGWIEEMRQYGFEIGYGVRRQKIGPGKLATDLSYVVAVPVSGGTRPVAVEREPGGS